MLMLLVLVLAVLAVPVGLFLIDRHTRRTQSGWTFSGEEG